MPRDGKKYCAEVDRRRENPVDSNGDVLEEPRLFILNGFVVCGIHYPFDTSDEPPEGGEKEQELATRKQAG